MLRLALRIVSALLIALLCVTSARADDSAISGPKTDFSASDILGDSSYFRLQSAIIRYTMFNQSGHGYQSRAGLPGGLGNEHLSVFEPELEVVVAQGNHLTHRVDVPVDIVTAASPDAIDLTTAASRRNEAGAIDWTASYQRANDTFSIKSGFHAEENYRAWNEGIAYSRSFADDNTVVAASLNEGFDWFDHYTYFGKHQGHSARSSSNANAGVTQLLSPTTVMNLNYGFTEQRGQLSNGWNVVPTIGIFANTLERLPPKRERHAIVGKIAQYLPWSGALKVSYRFYRDDWSLTGHTVEAELDQRITPELYLGGTYRFHHQTAVDFFMVPAPDSALYATADSDLDLFTAQTVGLKAVLDLPLERSFAKTMHIDLGVERYVRTNDLSVNVVTCALGFFH